MSPPSSSSHPFSVYRERDSNPHASRPAILSRGQRIRNRPCSAISCANSTEVALVCPYLVAVSRPGCCQGCCQTSWSPGWGRSGVRDAEHLLVAHAAYSWLPAPGPEALPPRSSEHQLIAT